MSDPAAGMRRIAFDMPQEVLDAVDELVFNAGVKNRAELIRNALRLFAWFHAKTEEGYTLILAKDDEEFEVELDLSSDEA